MSLVAHGLRPSDSVWVYWTTLGGELGVDVVASCTADCTADCRLVWLTAFQNLSLLIHLCLPKSWHSLFFFCGFCALIHWCVVFFLRKFPFPVHWFGGRLFFPHLILLHDSVDQIVHFLGQGSFAFCEEYMWDHELGVSYASPKQFFLRNFKEYLSAC